MCGRAGLEHLVTEPGAGKSNAHCVSKGKSQLKSPRICEAGAVISPTTCVVLGRQCSPRVPLQRGTDKPLLSMSYLGNFVSVTIS